MIQLEERLKEILGEDLIVDADMSKYTSFKAGGKASYLAMPRTISKLRELLTLLDEENVGHIFLGNGSNTLFRDKGYTGVVVKLNPSIGEFLDISIEGTKAVAGTAVLMSTFAKAVAAKGLSGFEPMSGIPGSLGGACFMNAGAYGGEMKDVVVSVHAVSKDGRDERDFSLEEMDLGYRHSALEDNGYIAVSVTMELKEDDKDEILARMKDYTARRNEKQPVNYPSAGSFFKRPTGYFAGKLIEDAGLKGLTVGGAQVSKLHSGFVINIGGATEQDITDLMHLVQNTVKDKFGVDLEPEVRIVGDK
ncbi:MAG: UDP-N-acetylmuramate dehydrogenase [Clostridia bacterium]|nr:UDP-N-acetylmuramate dehydrogenase [Clostridia bacterium]